jgi:zinc transporter ZupT
MVEPSAQPIELLLRAAIPVGAAVVGGAAGALGTQRNRAVVGPMVHFAAGAFLGIALLHLIPEAAREAGWAAAVLAAAAGCAVCALLGRLTGAACPACEGHSATHVRVGTPLLWVAALHSVLDGFALADPHAHAEEAGLLSAAILLHKAPEGLAIGALFRAAGRTFPAALGLTAAVQSCTFIGAVGGALIGAAPPLLVGIAMAGVAGSFLYLVGLTLSGAHHTARPAFSQGATAAGAIVILIAHLALR